MDDDQIRGHVATADSGCGLDGIFANPSLEGVPGFGKRTAGQEITDDYRGTEGHHISQDGICGFEEHLVRAEDGDIEMHNGYLNGRVGCRPHAIQGYRCLERENQHESDSGRRLDPILV